MEWNWAGEPGILS